MKPEDDKRPMRTLRELYSEALKEPLPKAIHELLERLK